MCSAPDEIMQVYEKEKEAQKSVSLSRPPLGSSTKCAFYAPETQNPCHLFTRCNLPLNECKHHEEHLSRHYSIGI
jgi:hypothetical protein